MLTVGRPRCCSLRDPCCGPYTIAIVIMVSAVPRGVGADGRAAAVLYPEGSVLTAGRPRSCTPRDRFCGPYNIAIAIIVGDVPLGIGAGGRAAAELYPSG